MTIFNESWHKKLESAQYNAALAITGAVPGINTIKLYQELRLESLQNRRKVRRLSLNYKLYNEQSPLYPYNLFCAMLLPTMFSNKLFWSLFASVLIKVLTSLLLGFSHLRGHKFNHNFSDCLDQIYVCGKLFISSSNVPYFLKKGKSSWIKFVILTVHLLIKMKTLSVIHIFLVKRTWMTVIRPIFVMQRSVIWIGLINPSL